MLNNFLNIRRLSGAGALKAVIALTTLALFCFMLSCGKRKPPLPPIERVSQRVEIKGFQRGNQIRLSWTMPVKNAPDGSVLNISRADIYRLAEPLQSPQSLTEDEFSTRSTLIYSLKIEDSDFDRKTLDFFDKLEFAGQNIRLRYAIRFVNSAGQKAAFSNFLLIEPAAKIANPPDVSPIRVTQDSLLVSWTAPGENIDGSKPANILGFNIYKSTGDQVPAKLLNTTPNSRTEFRDSNFSFGQRVRYFVRTVSLGTNAEPVESLESNVVEITPKDVFPPNPPDGITLAASPNTISIFFAANLESDIAGYKVFRSSDKINWLLITEKLLETNTYQDSKVEAGRTYYYYLIAVDRSGNESGRSEIVSETVP